MVLPPNNRCRCDRGTRRVCSFCRDPQSSGTGGWITGNTNEFVATSEAAALQQIAAFHQDNQQLFQNSNQTVVQNGQQASTASQATPITAAARRQLPTRSGEPSSTLPSNPSRSSSVLTQPSNSNRNSMASVAGTAMGQLARSRGQPSTGPSPVQRRNIDQDRRLVVDRRVPIQATRATANHHQADDSSDTEDEEDEGGNDYDGRGNDYDRYRPRPSR